MRSKGIWYQSPFLLWCTFLFTFFLWNVLYSFYYLSSLMISQLTGFLFPPWLHTDCTTCSSASWKYTFCGSLNYFCSELIHKSIGLDLFLFSHDQLYHTVFPPILPNVSIGLFFSYFSNGFTTTLNIKLTSFFFFFLTHSALRFYLQMICHFWIYFYDPPSLWTARNQWTFLNDEFTLKGRKENKKHMI